MFWLLKIEISADCWFFLVRNTAGSRETGKTGLLIAPCHVETWRPQSGFLRPQNCPHCPHLGVFGWVIARKRLSQTGQLTARKKHRPISVCFRISSTLFFLRQTENPFKCRLSNARNCWSGCQNDKFTPNFQALAFKPPQSITCVWVLGHFRPF